MNAPFSPVVRSSTLTDAGRSKYKLRVDDYLLLDEAGVFRGEQTELVDGDVIVMSPEWRPHMRIKDELAYRLRRALKRLGSDLDVGTGGTVALSEVNQPRPDIILTREILGEGPIPVASVALLVEVSSTTLTDDVETKAPLYARYGVPEYWVVDVRGRVVHQMWSPSADKYREGRGRTFGQRLVSASVQGLAVQTTGL